MARIKLDPSSDRCIQPTNVTDILGLLQQDVTTSILEALNLSKCHFTELTT